MLLPLLEMPQQLLLLLLLLFLRPCGAVTRLACLAGSAPTCSAKLASHSRSSLWKVMSALSATSQLGLFTRLASL